MRLFAHLAQLHVDAPPDALKQFSWVKSQSFGGSASILHWNGDRASRSDRIRHNQSELQELVDERLLRRGDGRNRLRLDAQAVRFHRWRTEQAGPEPIQQVETAVRTMLDEPDRLGRRHPEVAHHLAAAFDLLWAETLDDRTIINLGGELRSALSQMAVDLVGYDGDSSPEKVATALKPWLEEHERLPPRSAELLDGLVRWAARGTQRVHHLHDERSEGRPDPDRQELRRVAFAVAFVVHEIVSVER